MKTAKPPAPEGATASSRRAQPVRQTRINPPRTSSLNRANPLGGSLVPEQPINILPGVTHFADAITALPKELVRHFTLLKEVDAKIFTPEAALFQLLNGALNTPIPDAARSVDDSSGSVAPQPAPMSAQNSSTRAAEPPKNSSAVFDPSNIPRRTLFRDTALKIQEMLVSLEEKNHVISTANDALQKQLGRIEEIWPHLEAEFSDEAKWGSTTHWAYVENRQAKANDKQAERSRREGAATLSAAAQALAEEAAARSSDRKQAIAAKKNAKNQVADADGDKAQEGGKKTTGGGKARKPLPDSATPVGLGITPGLSGSGSAPSKRRKVETAKSAGATPAERAMGSVFGNSAGKQRTTSPRETPVPEGGTKKRKALPGGSSQAKKSRTNAPSVTSSPVIGMFPDPVKGGRGSPAPSTSAPRPASSRARQNSTVSNDNARQRPASTTSNKPNGNLQGTPDPGQQTEGAKPSADGKAQKEAAMPVLSKPNPAKPEAEEPPPVPEAAQNGGSKKDSAAKSNEDKEPTKKEATSLVIQPTPPTVKTKSGRASKPSTPAIGTFAEAGFGTSTAATTAGASSRSRPSRNNNNTDCGPNTATSSTTTGSGLTTATTTTPTATTTTTKRSHKKGASVSATAAQAAQVAQQTAATAAAEEKEKDKKDKDKDAKEKDKEPSSSKQHHQQQQQNEKKGDSSSSSSNNNNKRIRRDANNVDVDVDVEDDEEEDEEPAGDDEPLYCYCNQISYGEMVACDGEGCPREWFHLECVGLKVAPKGNAKWYCEDCKKRLKGAERR